MLENYFKSGAIQTDEKTQRLLAVQAALEIAKASASSGGGVMHSDLDQAAERIGKLADAIQAAIKK
ncbi:MULTISPECIES: hypothetical protein [Enterobacter]|uniref:hypothetical protein n=1 Tax=Enterobacter TaxID=547 RepID=UPI0018A8ACE9|nr:MULTISPECIES: hypothetical protein [Enterobacter]HBM2703580.1 hypothetical protein [Enterobacter hormaechei subsp. xiangfangensis]HDR2451696.1 hypothetical protein [Enterobacter ludwigii]ELN4418084.1 hypothetical protein [Enterobacter hormaechei]MBF9834224.1 hypothetical protein [Enterobacter hormaechei]MBT1882560.1 hypothetical protein [Enterobacter mori]